ncbi:MAG: hypothetical protein HDS49_06165 [Bacteroides sp.]|nr:hypothetical protein [Bacteroides sp.]
MNHSNHLILAATLFSALICGTSASAQETSPYSKFGYGILSDNASSSQLQMGSTGYAEHSGRQVNAMNPAAYASTDSMTFLFDLGVSVNRYWRKDDSGSQKDWGGGINYVTMQFPVAKNVGMSIGLVPYSAVGYAFGSTVNNGYSSHQGSGGINQLYVGAAWSPVKGLSAGFNVGYLFGNIGNDVYATTSTGVGAVFEQVMEVQDYHFRLGAQYTYPINRRDNITLGVTFDPGKSMLGKTYVLKYLQSSSTAPDTVAPGVVRLKGNFSMAPSWGAGIAWDRDNRIHAELDFTYQPWKNAKYSQIENFSSTRLDNRFRVALGGSYMHDPRGSYFKRVTYRAGFYYNRDYIMVGDNHIHDWAVSCGLGLPTSQSKTLVNLGFQYLNRSASPASLVNEKYFNVTLGINFNATWFFHRQLR